MLTRNSDSSDFTDEEYDEIANQLALNYISGKFGESFDKCKLGRAKIIATVQGDWDLVYTINQVLNSRKKKNNDKEICKEAYSS